MKYAPSILRYDFWDARFFLSLALRFVSFIGLHLGEFLRLNYGNERKHSASTITWAVVLATIRLIPNHIGPSRISLRARCEYISSHFSLAFSMVVSLLLSSSLRYLMLRVYHLKLKFIKKKNECGVTLVPLRIEKANEYIPYFSILLSTLSIRKCRRRRRLHNILFARRVIGDAVVVVVDVIAYYLCFPSRSLPSNGFLFYSTLGCGSIHPPSLTQVFPFPIVFCVI